MASLNDILIAVGRLQEGLERLTEDFAEEKKSAHESRATIHKRLDEQVGDIASLKLDVAVSAQIDAQVRDQIAGLKEASARQKEEIQPSIDEWKRMKTIGVGITGVIAIGGLTVGSVLVWASETAASAIRQWLRIG